MIAELLTTIIMALGVATGNVSSNSYKSGNAFNNVEKESKPQQKVTENYQIIINGVNVIQTYNNNNTPNENDVLIGEKQYLGTNSTTANYYNDWLVIRNSLYSYTLWQNDKTIHYYWILLQITPYYGSHQDSLMIDIDTYYTPYTATQTDKTLAVYKHFYTTPTDLSQWIDLQMNASTNTSMADMYANTTKENTNDAVDYLGRYAQMQTPLNIGFQNTIYDIQDGETKNAVIFIQINDSTKYTYTSRLDYLTIDGRVISTPINYEVVDIPNLMYTILVMPFSFISAAFNLTVFPGTPYALNFGNLFLTILAVFILMWLLKKVFK